MLPSYRPPQSIPETVPSGTTCPNLGPPRDGQKVYNLAGSKKEFFKI
jgi:hypothetical protein